VKCNQWLSMCGCSSLPNMKSKMVFMKFHVAALVIKVTGHQCWGEETRVCLWLHSTQVSTWSSTSPFHLTWIWQWYASHDLYLNTILPTGTNNVHFKLIDGTPGLAVRTSSTQSWTPIASRTRTRARLKMQRLL